MTLIADGFLAGSLLSLLLPTALLIALVVWYVGFLRRLPDPIAGSETVAPAMAGGPAAAPAAAGSTGAGTAPAAVDPPG